jgi:hypothetical protein
LRTEDRKNQDLGAVVPKSEVPLNLQMSKTRIRIRLFRIYFPRNWEFSSALSKLLSLLVASIIFTVTVSTKARTNTELVIHLNSLSRKLQPEHWDKLPRSESVKEQRAEDAHGKSRWQGKAGEK